MAENNDLRNLIGQARQSLEADEQAQRDAQTREAVQGVVAQTAAGVKASEQAEQERLQRIVSEELHKALGGDAAQGLVANAVAQRADAPWVPFRYCSKASRRDRNAGCERLPASYLATMGDGIGAREHNPDQPTAWTPNDHPTCKPTALMAWLCKLVTKEGGVVLDCFGGSGSTGVAAVRSGMRAIIIEQDGHYCDIARARIGHAAQQRSGPLFAGVSPSPSPDAAR